MSVRVGVDVGGTFTKAVACAPDGSVVARAVIPTTHADGLGVARGVIDTITQVVGEVGRTGTGPVALISHSTTQAVNALLEGDTATVGVLGLGRRPDLRKARGRTKVGRIGLAPGRFLHTLHRFVDASATDAANSIRMAVRELRGEGAEVIAVSESFGVDDPSGELLAQQIATEEGLPSCAGHELTGIYGLEMRTVTSALNASILPMAARASQAVAEGARRDAPDAPLLVMRGDGGAADLSAMGSRPLLTAFSGPAASVSGALRHLPVTDAVIIEVGGTSTNVSVVSGGRPHLAYVRVLRHLTSVRSLDVRVAGVAGGSMLRSRTRLGRRSALGLGPRSAHIAGLPYCSFTDDLPADISVRMVAPRPGDPSSYLALETRAGDLLAPTLTCAANALGMVPAGTAAEGNTDSAAAAFEALGAFLGRSGTDVAEQTVRLAAGSLAGVVRDALADHHLDSPVVIGLGGGAGSVVPRVAELLGLEWEIPPEAAVISSIGDALSVVRIEFEHAVSSDIAADVRRVVEAAEREAVSAGAAPDSVQVEVESVSDRGALRAVAVGTAEIVGSSGNVDVVSDEVRRGAAVAVAGPDAETLVADEYFSVFAEPGPDERRVAVVDRWGAVAWSGQAYVVVGAGAELAPVAAERITALARRLGPAEVAPSVVLIRGARLVDLSLYTRVDPLVEAVAEECAIAGLGRVVCLIRRSD